MANVLDGDFDPLSPTPSPGARALNGGGPDSAEAAKTAFFRRQLEREEELANRESELYRKREEEEAPLRADVMRSEREFLNTSNIETERLRHNQQPIPKFDRREVQGDILNMVAIASTFGALAGGLSRNHMTAAMNAFSGALRGFAKGQITAFDQKYAEWQANTDRALEYNRRMVDEYKAIMGNAKLGVDVKANLLEMTANKWQDQITANAAQMRDLERTSQWIAGQDRANERLDLTKKTIEKHVEALNLQMDQRKDQMYGSAQDVHATADQILGLAVPMPTANMQARYKYLRDAAQEVMKRNPGYKASDFTSNNALQKAAATANVMALRSSLTKLTQMKTALDTFEPVAKLNGNMMLGLIGQVDQTGNQTVIEAWLRAGKKATGDPNVAQFDMAVKNLQVESARILQNPNLVGQLTDTMRGEISSILPENITKANVERQVPALFQEMDYRKSLIDSQIDFINQSLRAAATPGAPLPQYVNPEPPPIIPPALAVPGLGGSDEYLEVQ